MQAQHEVVIEVTQADIQTSNRHSPEDTAILEGWFDQHRDWPYLEPHGRDDLLSRTSLNRKQLDAWLNNARSRRLAPQDHSMESSVGHSILEAGARCLESWLSTSSQAENSTTETIHNECLVQGHEPLRAGSRTSGAWSMGNSRARLRPSSRRSSQSSHRSALDTCPEARRTPAARRGRRRCRLVNLSRVSSRSSLQDESFIMDWPLATPYTDTSMITPCPEHMSSATSYFPEQADPLANPHGSFVYGYDSSLAGSVHDDASNWSQEVFDGTPATSPEIDFSHPYDSIAAVFRDPTDVDILKKDDRMDGLDSPNSYHRPFHHETAGFTHMQDPCEEVAVDESQLMRTPSSARSAATADYDDDGLFFQCTFCHEQLRPKSWKRHEESQHLPQKQYTCMPFGLPIASGTSNCVFCGAFCQDEEHNILCSRRVFDCLQRPLDERTFGRRDKLVQHIRTFHYCNVEKHVLETWSSTARDYTLVFDCGFCDERNMTWKTRAAHIASHFRDGMTMSSWKSGVSAIATNLRE